MGKLKAGFARVNINPMLNIGISGYFKLRKADGILDDLEINAVALQVDSEKALMISVDNLGIAQTLSKTFRDKISEATGVSAQAVYISATHTHTGPYLRDEGFEDELLEKEYAQFVTRRIVDVSRMALEDMESAKMGWGVGNAPNVAFIRRFRMKDGSVKTNPGVNNPDILSPIGEVDERVSVVRFDRQGKENIVLVNFANHPDVVGGNKISADWPGLLRKTVEKTIDNVKCIFFNGAQGDVNHVNVHPTGGYLNDMFMDFDDVARGYKHALYIARVITGGVLQVYDKVKYTETESLKFIQKPIKVASNMADPADLPKAKRIVKLHEEGRDDEIGEKGMMLTTVVAEARRMILLKDGPAAFDMLLSGIAVGPVAFVGIPGEPFNAIGRALKDTDGFELIIPTCITNGYQGYFPTKDAYDEGGYEARSSNFRSGTAEYIIEQGKQLLKELSE